MQKLLFLGLLLLGCANKPFSRKPLDSPPASPPRTDAIADLSAIDIKIIFLRHGISCTNLTGFIEQKKIPGKKFPNFLHYLDPELSSIGQRYTVNNGKSLQNYLASQEITVDFIGSSSLLRAIETAHFLFNTDAKVFKKIYPLPYLKELGKVRSDFPSAIKEQREFLSTADGLSGCNSEKITADCPLDYTFLKTSDLAAAPASFEQFKEWLGNNLEAILSNQTSWSPQPQGRMFTMAVVAHRGVMKRELKIQDNVDNNSAFQSILRYARHDTSWKYKHSESQEFSKLPYPFAFALPSSKKWPDLKAELCPDRCREFNICSAHP